MKEVLKYTLDDRKVTAAVLFVTIFFSFFVTLGTVPLFDLDEGAFSEATREMIASGNYLTTYLNGELRFDKPILIYWFQALSASVFGIQAFAFRLPSAIAASLWALFLFAFAAKWMDVRRAFFSAFFLVTALQITIIARAAIADALLNLFLALSLFHIFLHHRTDQKNHIRLAFLYIGLGTLTKGPVAILVPGAVSFLFYFATGEIKRWFQAIFNPVGIGIFLAVALPWYILEYIDQGQKFIDGFLFRHNVERFQTPFEGHTGSLLYYIPVVLIGLLPHTAFFIRALFAARSELQTQNTDEKLLAIFAWIWFAFVFLFFSFSGTKLPHYLIYGYTPVFLLMGYHLYRVENGILAHLPGILAGLILVFLPEILELISPSVSDPLAKIIIRDAADYLGPVYRIGVSSVLVFYLAAIYFHKKAEHWDLVASGFVMVATVSFVLVPLASSLLQKPIYQSAILAKKNDYDVVMWKMNNPSFNVYAERLVEKRHPEKGDVVLTRTYYLKFIDQYSVLYQKHGVALVRVHEIKKDLQWHVRVMQAP